MFKNIQNTLFALAFTQMLALANPGLNIESPIQTSFNLGLALSPKTESSLIEILRIRQAEKIDKYFADRTMPLRGYGMKFVLVAEKYGLPYNFLPAIAVIESSGGKAAFNQNPFGWGSAKIPFKSFEEAIEVVGKNLGGANPKTVQYYASPAIEDKLWHYNESVVSGYTERVKGVMKKIEANA